MSAYGFDVAHSGFQQFFLRFHNSDSRRGVKYSVASDKLDNLPNKQKAQNDNSNHYDEQCRTDCYIIYVLRRHITLGGDVENCGGFLGSGSQLVYCEFRSGVGNCGGFLRCEYRLVFCKFRRGICNIIVNIYI